MSADTMTMTAPPVSAHQSADPTQEPRRRVLSGEFEARNLSAEWAGAERLAALCQQAGFTAMEARTVLLYVAQQRTAPEIAVILAVKRQHVWRYLRHAGRKVLRTWPDLDAALRQWSEGYRQGALDVLECFRNSHGSDRAPLLMRNAAGQYRVVTAPRLVDWRQLLEVDVSLVAVERLPSLECAR